MEKNNTYIEAEAKNMLKQNTLKHLPRNLSDTAAQGQILRMIADAIPPVMSCVDHAETQIWKRVEDQELAINQAVIQCAYQTDKIIGASDMENLALKSLSEEVLQKAWIALEYYAYVLKEEYAANIHSAQNIIGNILLDGKDNGKVDNYGPTEPAGKVEDYGPTEPAGKVEDYGPTEPAGKVEDYGPTEPAGKVEDYGPTQPAGTVVDYDRTQPARGAQNFAEFQNGMNGNYNDSRHSKKKTKKLALLGTVVAAVVLVVLVIAGAISGSKIQGAVNAIEEIGKVTMESAEKIEIAEQYVGELTDKQKSKVDNLSDLINARREYNRLNTAVQKASDAIDAIGKVTLDSGSKIKAARSAYDALKKDHLESYVSDKMAILTKAEKEYEQYVSEDLYDIGVDSYDRGDYEGALETFESIVADYPNCAIVDDAKDAVANCQIALAEEAHKKNDEYTAMKILSEVDKTYQSVQEYQDVLKKIKNSLASRRPSNGYVVDATLGWGQCYAEVKTGDKDVCFKLENMDDPSKYKMVFLRANTTTKINVEDGEYIFKWATGECWFGLEQLFGDATIYQQEDGYGSFITEWNGNTVYFWYYELDLSVNIGDYYDITPERF